MTRPTRGPSRGLAGVAGMALAGALLMAGAPAVGAAQGGTPLERGLAALHGGSYDDAVRLLAGATASGPVPRRVQAARALAEAHAATGAYEAALAALDGAEGVPAGSLALARGRVLRRLGRHEEAGAAFAAAVAAGSDDALAARLEGAVLDWERGRRAAAYRSFDRFIDAYNDGRARTAPELVAVGTALRYLARRDPDLRWDALRAYEEALAADPASHEARLAMAGLLLDAYNGAEAQPLLAEVLEANPRHPAALRAMARAKRFEGSDEALALAERALAVDARSAEGHTLLALLRLELGADVEAVAGATRALERDGSFREALAVRAAARLLAGERGRYREDRRRALEIDPLYAGFYVVAGELAVRRGRYAEAVELAAEAVALDSTAWDAWALLGMNQLRTGALTEARSSLERAYQGDPFNAWTFNTLDLVERLTAFETVRTPRFELVMDPAEAGLLAPYAEAVAEEAYEALARRYGYRPETPVRVEIYPRNADFSVRTTGLAGLAALGVAFGNVLALNSPSARADGEFNWASTFWHEVAHSVTLGRTRHRIPRWLTEGISVHEERRSRPGWGGDVPPAFLQAYLDDRLLPLTSIDAGFVRPSYTGQVAVSYQHASLMVALVEEDHGTAGLIRLMDAYADGRDTDAALRDALGTTPGALDDRLRAHVEARYARGLAAVRGLMEAGGVAGHGGRGEDVAAVVRSARLDRGDFGRQLAAGRALHEAGRSAEAEPFLERALELWPGYAGPGSPYALLASIRSDRGDVEGAIGLLERLTLQDETARAANLELARLLRAAGRDAAAVAPLERAIFIYPHDPVPHARLAELAESLGRAGLEVRERRALLALDPVDRAEALYRLALAERRAGDGAAARRTVMRALEVAPGYAAAQELFLELSGGGP